MATHSDTTGQRTGQEGFPAPLVEYERYIDSQIRKTRSHVRGVDLASGLLTLVTGTLAFIFVAAIVDHWIVSGGLGFVGRLLLLVVYAVGALYYLARHVLPLVVRRINPMFAAHTIERSSPGLKNGLLNFLFFREQQGGLPPLVYQALEEQAATRLAKAQVETAVDRTKLIHIGYALVGVLLLCAVYTLFSPKDLLKTVGRVVMPWSDIAAPTRTAIVEIEPGDVRAFRGQQVAVAARINGLPADVRVTLYYTTADGQTVDRPVEMNLPPDGYKHACLLPSGDQSLQQSLIYRIEAGDAVTRSYKVEVVAAPTLVVESVDYKYPKYTGLLSQRVEHQGDLKALEGTEVTLHAVANQDMQSAAIDFNCDGKHDVRMKTEGQAAEGVFTLQLRSDRQGPLHDNYQLVLKNEQGQQNPQPVRHQIEVTRDLAPEIQFVAPKEDEIELPLNRKLDLELVGNDPDFSLRRVRLTASVAGKPLVEKLLLDEPWRGQWSKQFRFDPRKLGLKNGDMVEYTAAAEDNKDPRPNRTATTTRRIRIVSPRGKSAQNDPLAQRGKPGSEAEPSADDQAAGGSSERSGDKGPEDDQQAGDDTKPGKSPAARGADDAQQPPAGKSEPSADAGAEPPPSEAGERGDKEAPSQAGKKNESKPAQRGDEKSEKKPENQPVPSDGTDDGSAFEKILQRQEEQGKSDPPSGDPKQQQKKPQPAGGDKQPPGKSGEQEQQSAEGQGEQPGQDQQSGSEKQDKPGDQSQPGKEPGGETGGEKPEQKPGKQPDKSDRSQGDAKQKGAGGGEGGQGNDSPGGQDGQQGQSGQQGQPGKSGSQGKGGGNNPGQSGENGQGEKSTAGEGSKQGDASQPGDDPAGKQESGKQDGAKPNGKSKPGGQKGSAPSAADGAGEQGGEKAERPKPGEKPPKSRDGQAPDDAGEGQQSDQPSGAEKPQGKSKSDGPGRGEKRPADQDADGEPRESNAGDGKQPDGQAKSGRGEKSKGDAAHEKSQKPSGDKQDGDAEGGDPEQEKGEAGAGQKSQDAKGSPQPMNQNKPREKSERGSKDNKEATPSDAQSSSADDKESDSEGAEGGDRSGGGKKGGGQRANKSGTGSAGQNTPADEGAGQSEEPGEGEASGRAGKQAESKQKTGQSGSQPGDGSRDATGAGDKSGGEHKPPSDSGSPADSSGNGKQQSQQPPGQPKNGTAGGGGAGQATQVSRENSKPGEEHADEANLNYARKATDLALTHLKDELKKNRPDPELLDRLGWSKQDLARFVQRWEQMRKQSQAPGEKGAGARRELDESLRSLGLRPKATSLKSKSTRDDKLEGVKESRHTTPPPEYLEQSKTYSQGTARGGK